MSLTPETAPNAGGAKPRMPQRVVDRHRGEMETGLLPNIELRKVITVQGESGSGKTTLGKELARYLGWVHFSSGLLYRAAGYLVREAKLPSQDETVVTAALMRAFTPEGFRKGSETFSFSLRVVERHGLKKIHLFLDRREDAKPLKAPVDLTEKLHKDKKVADIASDVAVFPSLREFFRGIQLRGLRCENLVVDGRDSHKVFRDAAVLKFWVDADPNLRAARVLAEDKIFPGDPRFEIQFSMALSSLGGRDQKDKNRTHDPATRPRRGFITVPNNSPTTGPALDLMLSKVEPELMK